MRKAEEVEESFYQPSINNVFVLIDDSLSSYLDIVNGLTARDASAPLFESFRKLLLVYLKFLRMKDGAFKSNSFVSTVIFFKQHWQFLRIVSPSWPFSCKILIMPVKAASTDIESVVMAHRCPPL